MNNSDNGSYASSHDGFKPRACDDVSSSEGLLSTSFQPYSPYPNANEDFDGLYTGSFEYDVSWNCSEESQSSCYWDEGLFHYPSRAHTDSPNLELPSVPDAAAQIVIRSPLISPVTSEHYNHSAGDIRQQAVSASPEVGHPLEIPYSYSTHAGLHDSHQLPSPAFSSLPLSPDRPISRPNSELPQSPCIAASNFGASSHGDSDEEDKDCSEPYAKLIYRALMSVPEHRMVLKDIYKWFERNTTKTRNAKSKGWQNSIRHNLSMNGVSLFHQREKCKCTNLL